jgi:phenolphthiocerol/phthiocerol/phthiodiolone dimycocerosyl transferase
MRRALCPVETLYVGQRSRAVLSCSVRGRVYAALLARAFDEVIAEHPTLRARIVPDGSGHAFELLGSQERPRLDVRTGVDIAHDDELNDPLPVGGPLVRATLASDPADSAQQSHILVISVDHAVIDGHSAIALQNAVWDRYRALVDGEPTSAPAREPGWPAPISSLLPPADEAATAEYLRSRLAEVRRNPVELLPYDGPGSGGRIEIRRLLLDAERTTALRESARAAGVSAHGLISAALLSVARARFGGDAPRVLGCLSPVDLRSRLVPPVPPTEMVAGVATHLHALPVAANPEPGAMARELTAHLRAAIARGEHFHDMRITPEVPRNPALQMATVIATNMGAVPGPRLPTGLELTDVRLVPGREHYFPQAGRSPLMACVVTFDGRLAVELPHHTACFSAEFMRAFRDDLRSALLSPSAPHELPA